MLGEQTSVIGKQTAVIGKQVAMRFLGGLDPCQSLSYVAQELFVPIETRTEGANVRLD